MLPDLDFVSCVSTTRRPCWRTVSRPDWACCCREPCREPVMEAGSPSRTLAHAARKVTWSRNVPALFAARVTYWLGAAQPRDAHPALVDGRDADSASRPCKRATLISVRSGEGASGKSPSERGKP